MKKTSALARLYVTTTDQLSPRSLIVQNGRPAVKNQRHHREIHCPVRQERNPQGECIYALPKWPSQEVVLFVKLLISEPIRLPNGTTEDGIKPFFNGIGFHIEKSMGIQILTEYAHYTTESDFVIIDQFAITFDISDMLRKRVPDSAAIESK
ncbi:hypothetical protein DPMN_009023 [Dreissena polymorpha]|uniref:Uncharacterized protein n=1 Tax=Dreissena polymorpha TaxID=45954 RepID=A0A9D4MYV0_DREPO|nr:hypothetical protein DPMN_009023 [Dreissena polymorpha]